MEVREEREREERAKEAKRKKKKATSSFHLSKSFGAAFRRFGLRYPTRFSSRSQEQTRNSQLVERGAGFVWERGRLCAVEGGAMSKEAESTRSRSTTDDDDVGNRSFVCSQTLFFLAESARFRYGEGDKIKSSPCGGRRRRAC